MKIGGGCGVYPPHPNYYWFPMRKQKGELSLKHLSLYYHLLHIAFNSLAMNIYPHEPQSMSCACSYFFLAPSSSSLFQNFSIGLPHQSQQISFIVSPSCLFWSSKPIQYNADFVIIWPAKVKFSPSVSL